LFQNLPVQKLLSIIKHLSFLLLPVPHTGNPEQKNSPQIDFQQQKAVQARLAGFLVRPLKRFGSQTGATDLSLPLNSNLSNKNAFKYNSSTKLVLSWKQTRHEKR
jgi:hypothetical protein